MLLPSSLDFFGHQPQPEKSTGVSTQRASCDKIRSVLHVKSPQIRPVPVLFIFAVRSKTNPSWKRGAPELDVNLGGLEKPATSRESTSFANMLRTSSSLSSQCARTEALRNTVSILPSNSSKFEEHQVDTCEMVDSGAFAELATLVASHMCLTCFTRKCLRSGQTRVPQQMLWLFISLMSSVAMSIPDCLTVQHTCGDDDGLPSHLECM